MASFASLLHHKEETLRCCHGLGTYPSDLETNAVLSYQWSVFSSRIVK